MYEGFFNLSERPFSITPNPRYVFLSQRHQDALAHLLYGVGTGGSGGFVQLTGEVGTGKTTLCRLALEQIPEKTRVALILNPMLGPLELIEAICEELEIDWASHKGSGILRIHGALNRYLLDRHAAGERVVVIIDEAQNLSSDALEQVRLLTNLETATDKLLQIILIGQPELREGLRKPSLRQLAQRITARFHLEPLDRSETKAYVRHRLMVAGAPRCPFTEEALDELFDASGGVPRLINIIADRALLAGFASETETIGVSLVRAAGQEVMGEARTPPRSFIRGVLAVASVVGLMLAGLWMAWILSERGGWEADLPRPVWQEALLSAGPEAVWQEVASIWLGLSENQIMTACEGSANVIQGVACLWLRGSWQYIADLNMPVILRMDGQLATEVLLVGLSEQVAVIRHQGQRHAVPVAELQRFWSGEFAVVWPDSGEVLRPGDESAAVAQAKALASELAVLPWQGTLDNRFDADFEAWLQSLQSRLGMTNNGFLDPPTRLVLRYPQQTLQDQALVPPLTTSGTF